MSETNFRYTNEKCPICNEIFNPDDDIVVCPYCGTPHHRECYKTNTKCANNDKHGEFRWEADSPSQKQEKSSPQIENTKSQDEEALPFGMQLPIMPANPLSEFPTDFDEDIKTEDLAYFTQQNAIKYIRNFYRVRHKRSSWNWAAFLFAPCWFFYRKLYKLGAIFMAIFIGLSSLSLFPPAIRYAEAVLEQEEEIMELSKNISDEEEYEKAVNELSATMIKIVKENKVGIILILSQSVLSLAISVYVGANANKWYYKHTMAEIKKIKANNNSGDYKEALYKRGGVSYGHAGLSILGERALLFLIEMILSLIIL